MLREHKCDSLLVDLSELGANLNLILESLWLSFLTATYIHVIYGAERLRRSDLALLCSKLE